MEIIKFFRIGNRLFLFIIILSKVYFSLKGLQVLVFLLSREPISVLMA